MAQTQLHKPRDSWPRAYGLRDFAARASHYRRGSTIV
jgi:hypothetical protein